MVDNLVVGIDELKSLGDGGSGSMFRGVFTERTPNGSGLSQIAGYVTSRSASPTGTTGIPKMGVRSLRR